MLSRSKSNHSKSTDDTLEKALVECRIISKKGFKNASKNEKELNKIIEEWTCEVDSAKINISRHAVWEWNDVVQAVDVTTLRPVKWKLDGMQLEEIINRSLPNEHNGKIKEGFLYTYPKINPPKNAKPWSNSQQTCVKKETVSSEHSPKGIQRLAVKKQPEPQPENSSNVYDALREIANSPKNK